MRAALVVVCLLGIAAESSAQKPLGVFDPGPNPPDWAQFGTIGDTVSDDRLREAAALSRVRGFKWLLALGYYESPIVPIGPHAARVRARLEATGLYPHVVAMSVYEETYEHWLAGSFAPYGLAADNPAGTAIIHDWMGRQHAAAKAALGLPVVWITNVAGHPSGTFRPVPAHVDYVALDPYVPEGGTFETHVAPLLAYSEQHTTHPLVLIPQYFAQAGYESPTEAMVARYAAILARPRYMALLAFTWRDRPWMGMTGLENLPIRAAVERSLGVK